MTTNEITVLVANYVAAWSEPDPASRQRLLEIVWDDKGTYTDPMSSATGRSELDALIAHFLGASPGAKFIVNGKIDRHHSHVRFYWRLRLATGLEMDGMDYGELSPAGKLVKIVGFF